MGKSSEASKQHCDNETANLSIDKHQRQTLLVVDDHHENLGAMQALFQRYYTVITKDNAKDAIKCAVEKSIDLILLDVDMPQMSGYQACKILKADPTTNDIPIIFVTAAARPKDEETGLSLGAVDYVHKPINFTTLLARVKNHMKLVRYQRRLELLSKIDGLTGTLNRRQLDIVLNQQFAAAARFGHCLTLLMIDIDNFKSFNDAYGHVKGDECLKLIAQAIMSVQRRDTDTLGRYGGEEFALVLPDTDRQGGLTIAKRALEKVRNLQIPHTGNSPNTVVTVSIGLAVFDATTQIQNKQDLENLIKEADEQLYRAKHNGRNQICCANDVSDA